MRLEPLKLTKKENIKWNKPDHIPPQTAGIFTTILTCGARGSGKTTASLQLIQNIANTNFYNRWVVVSPTSSQDLKMVDVMEQIEADKKNEVKRYKDLTNEIMEEILNEQKDYIKMWREYNKVRELIEKYKIKGVKGLTDDELEFLYPNLDDDFSELPNIHELLNEYPIWIQRDTPPACYIVLDDCFHSKLLTTQRSPLIEAYTNGRHYYISIHLIVQSLNQIPRSIRQNTLIYMMFGTRSSKDLRILYDEINNAFPNWETYLKSMEACNKADDYSFLYVDASSLKNPLVKCGFNKTINFT